MWVSFFRKLFIKSYTIKQLLDQINPTYLRHRERADRLETPHLSNVYASTLRYETKSSKFNENGKIWVQKILFQDFVVLAKDKGIPIEEAVDYAINDGDIHIQCNCLAPETQVLMENFEYKAISYVKKGEVVWTHGGNKAKVKAILTTEEEKLFYKIWIWKFSEPLIVSGDHKVLVRNDCDWVEWRKVSELTKKDYLVVPNYLIGKHTSFEIMERGKFFSYKPILEIEAVQGPKIAYDLSLDHLDHSFIANSIVVSNCPAFWYWGYRYMATQMGYLYGIPKENRAPTRNNVDLKGVVCKHCTRALEQVLLDKKNIEQRFNAIYRNTPQPWVEESVEEVTEPEEEKPSEEESEENGV